MLFALVFQLVDNRRESTVSYVQCWIKHLSVSVNQMACAPFKIQRSIGFVEELVSGTSEDAAAFPFDPPVTERGFQQAKKLAGDLRRKHVSFKVRGRCRGRCDTPGRSENHMKDMDQGPGLQTNASTIYR